MRRFGCCAWVVQYWIQYGGALSVGSGCPSEDWGKMVLPLQKKTSFPFLCAAITNFLGVLLYTLTQPLIPCGRNSRCIWQHAAPVWSAYALALYIVYIYIYSANDLSAKLHNGHTHCCLTKPQAHSAGVRCNAFTWPVHSGICNNWLLSAYECHYTAVIVVQPFCLRLKCDWQAVSYLAILAVSVMNTGGELRHFP